MCRTNSVNDKMINDKNIYLQNSNKTMQKTIQHPRDKPFIGAKYIKHHNLKFSLKSIKVNRDLYTVVTLVVTAELGKGIPQW